MELNRPDWPDAGDLVVGTVTRIVSYGAYATLDEYGDKEGLLHISEVSSRWVKNIRNHVKEKQKAVLKVLRIEPEKKQIDLSLRRVTGREKKEKLLEYKRGKRVKELMQLAAERMDTSIEEAYQKAGSNIKNVYGSVYAGFEEASEQGEDALTKAGVPHEWAKTLTKLAQAYVRVHKSTIGGIIKLNCTKPDGVNAIKEAVSQAKKIKKVTGANIKIYVIGAPNYRIIVSARDYKAAEVMMNEAVEIAIKSIENASGNGSFERDP